MHIPFLSRALALPFVLLIIYYFSYAQFQSDSADGWILIPSVIILMLLYVFSDQINKWWWAYKAPPLDPRIQSWIEVYSPIYGDLSSSAQKDFADRLSIFMHTKEFTLKGKKDFQLEEDMKAMIAHEFIRLTLYRQEGHMFPSLKHVVLYNHPFATPKKEFLHSFEYDRTDEVLILAREQMINGFNRGLNYYNILLHAAISVFINQYPRLDYPDVSDLDTDEFLSTFEIERSGIESALGITVSSKLPLLIYCHLEYPDQMKSFYPIKYRKLNNIFELSSGH